ncbi:chromosome segregation ATPase [Nostoc parmelioides]|uniref:Chromosome segregation ATPase n=1 Tax=Nostoc parmelioides FACHB-3921 TaxID=2692909 RepID=A0ABR8BIQ7_9NOSO|nr:chromosome segregation ATPase [Nostoc parmelioides]MBD2252833.1 chromosome segregation ATPase [Nostoc parmelioides FACHB-3921]
MTERDIPESWHPTRGRKPDEMDGVSRSPQVGDTQAFGVPAPGSANTVRQRLDYNTEELPINQQSKVTNFTKKNFVKLPRWMQGWVGWALLLTLLPGGIGFLAMAMLLKLPSAPNCPAIFWPLASASVRIHCAQLAASKQTVDDLLQAIALVKQLPQDHPLRGEADRFLEEWSRDVLELADESFQAGNLEQAIATAKKIPEDLTAYKLVDEQITKWQTIWSKAQGIYADAEEELRQQRWQSAFMVASQLLRVDNKYWASAKYDELNDIITSSKEDVDKLDKAQRLANSKEVDNLLEAIKLAESIEQKSYLYRKAQESIPAFGRKMLELAQAKMDARDADTALEIARQIPESTGLQTEVEDFIALGDARRNAWLGNIAGLETAISQAQQINASRPNYDQAQQLISRWQLEIEDVARLEKAQGLANQGTINDLVAAIAEAQMIPGSNPRGSEARQNINRWQSQVETIEDRPYLDRAEQIALLDDVNSLQAAIAEAGQIRQGRALYPEARRRIRTWVSKVQRIQDQPYLDQAREFAARGDLSAAINAAQTIASSGRALSGEAQTAIDDWRSQIRARDNWNRAREVAAAGTSPALAEAIRIANQVSNNSILRMDANIAIDQWGQQILDIARSDGSSDMSKAIETARLIPRSSSAYSAAQEQIKIWQQFLNPAPQPQPEQFEPSTIINGQ